MILVAFVVIVGILAVLGIAKRSRAAETRKKLDTSSASDTAMPEIDELITVILPTIDNGK